MFTVGSWAFCARGRQGGGDGARAGANNSCEVLGGRGPLKSTLQHPPLPGCKYTHSVSVSSTCSLDPWLTLHCNSSVVHSIFI